MGEENNKDIILSTLLEIRENIGSLKADVASIKVSMTTNDAKDFKNNKEFLNRLAKVENQASRLKWIAVGAAGVLTAAWRVVEALILPHR